MKYRAGLKRGFSMIEIIIVIAVIGVLTAVVLNLAKGMRESANINTEISNLSMLVSTSQSVFSSQGDYTGIQNNVITRSASFPTGMMGTNENTIKTSWHNAGVEFAESTYSAGADAFSITYNTVPHTSCVDFVSKTYKSYFRVQIGGTTVRDISASTANEGNIAGITGACPSNGDTTIVFHSR